MYKLIGVILLLLSGCTYLNDQHYNDVVNIDSNVNQLDKKDQRMRSELEAIKAAANKRSQGNEQ
ncbi:MAG: hypothetical protein ABUK11_04640 [Mariprofundaceae bacterium]